MVGHDAGDLARRLAENAEAVCRRYLSAGRRHGNYWLVGDVRNTPGRSLFVRLRDTAHRRAGQWTDAQAVAPGELLHAIRSASHDQHAGIAQVNQTIVQMESSTQRNASLVEEAGASTAHMQTQVQALADAVSAFRLQPERRPRAAA